MPDPFPAGLRWSAPWCGVFLSLMAVGLLSTASCRSRSGDDSIWTLGDKGHGLPRGSAIVGLDDDTLPVRQINLAGAVNETLSFRFVIRPSGKFIDTPGFRIAPFTSFGAQIDPVAIQIYRLHPATLSDRPGWHIRSVPSARRRKAALDVLVPIHAPRGGLPATLQPGETYDFWVDVTIPKGTFEGVYSSEIALTSKKRVHGSVAVQLEVWPFVLPDTFEPSILAAVDHRELFRHHVTSRARPYAPNRDDWRHDPQQAELDGLLSATLRMLRQHGGNAHPALVGANRQD